MRNDSQMAPEHSPKCAICSGQEAHKVVERHAGLGDTVAAIADASGLAKMAAWYERMTGKPCNCKTRQEILNKLVPYEAKNDPSIRPDK